jgi:hypothetical protein
MTDSSTSLKLFCCLLLASSLLLPCLVHAEGTMVSAGLGFEFASGKYGTDTKTDSIYVPFTVSVYPTERVGFSLEIPYVYRSNAAANTGVFLGGGATMHGQKSAAAMTGSAMGSGSMSTASTGRSDRSQSGVGDLIARVGYLLLPEGELMPGIRPHLLVKFPTADENKALGTGAFDEGFAVELFKRLGNWYTFAEAVYTLQGKSSLLPLKNYLSFNAGAGRSFGENFLPLLIVKGSTAPIEGSSDLLELRLKLKYLATAQTGIEGYLAKGITRNSPDYGSGLAIFYDF